MNSSEIKRLRDDKARYLAQKIVPKMTSADIEKQTKEFLEKGGEIVKCPTGSVTIKEMPGIPSKAKLSRL